MPKWVVLCTSIGVPSPCFEYHTYLYTRVQISLNIGCRLKSTAIESPQNARISRERMDREPSKCENISGKNG